MLNAIVRINEGLKTRKKRIVKIELEGVKAIPVDARMHHRFQRGYKKIKKLFRFAMVRGVRIIVCTHIWIRWREFEGGPVEWAPVGGDVDVVLAFRTFVERKIKVSLAVNVFSRIPMILSPNSR